MSSHEVVPGIYLIRVLGSEESTGSRGLQGRSSPRQQVALWWCRVQMPFPGVDAGFSRAVCSPPGLCALSINHSNSYVAYPGSRTTGEIVLYDGHALVSWR